MSTSATDPTLTTTQIVHVPDHRVQAQRGLTFPLRERPRAAALAAALGGAAQGFEDVMISLLIDGTIDNAVGTDLDHWGEVVGEVRGALLSDEQYRPFVRARILANRCNGTPDKLIEVFQIVTGPSLKIEYFPLVPAGLVLIVYRTSFMPETVRRRVRRLMDIVAPAGKTFEVYEAITGGWGPSPAPYTTPSGIPARVI